MTENNVRFLDLPLRQRMHGLVVAGIAFSVFGVPLYLLAAFGGRFQRDRGSVSDVGLLAGLYPIGLILSSVVAALCGRWWANRWTAALAMGLSTLPFFGLVSLADGHSGPTAPYRVDWSLVLGCSTVLAATTLIFYTYLARRFEAAQQRARRRRGLSSREHR